MRLSITKTLALGIVLLQVITVSVILLSSYVTTEQVLLGHAQQLMRNLSREVIHRSEEFLQPAKSAVSLTKSLALHDVVSTEKPNDMEQYFFDQLMLYPHIAGIYYGNHQGDFHFVRRGRGDKPYQIKRIIERSGARSVTNRWFDNQLELVTSSEDPFDDYDPRTRPWFIKAVSQRELIWTDPYLFFTSQTPGITVASPVHAADGTMLGVVGVDIDLSALSEFLGYLELSERGSALIMNNNGDIIAHRHDDTLVQREDGVGAKRLLRVDELGSPVASQAVASLDKEPGWYVLNTAKNTSFEFEGQTYQAVFTPFSDNWPWLLGIYMPEEDFLAEIKENQQFNLILAGIITLVSGCIGLLFARSISRPIMAIQKGVRAVKKGELEVDIETGSSAFNDLEETTSAFSKMLQSLKENRDKEETLQYELTKQAQFMQAVLENIEDGVVACDADGKFIFSNRAAVRLRGMDNNVHLDRLEEAPYRLLHEDGETPLKSDEVPLFRALSGQKVRNQEIVIVRADGERCIVRVSGNALYDGKGEKLGAVVSLHEITELRRNRDYLSYRAHVMGLLLKNSSLEAVLFSLLQYLSTPEVGERCALIAWDEPRQHLRIRAANNLSSNFKMRLEQQLDPSWLQSHRPGTLVVEDLAGERWQELAAALNEEQLQDCWSITIQSSDNQVLGCLLMFPLKQSYPGAELVQRIDMLAALLSLAIERQNNLEAINILTEVLEHLPNAVVITDAEGIIEYVNQQFLSSTGYNASEVIGCHPKLFAAEQTQIVNYTKVRHVLAQGQIWEGRLHNRRKNGETYWVKVAIYPVFDADQCLTHCISTQLETAVLDEPPLVDDLL